MIDTKKVEELIKNIPRIDNPRNAEGSTTREELEQRAKLDAEEEAKQEAQQAYDETYADTYEDACRRILEELLDEHGFGEADD
jgi:hypothetical protein